nr:hypothetical protein [Verrucomicrobium spinosum]
MQVSFDDKGRLWVAVMPTYPHYRPGDAMPNDKLLIYEDTNGDGKADKETVFADHLHLPIGFEFAPEGVYVSQEPNLVLLRDTNGDDKADSTEIVLGGFDSHDTHHAISAYAADPSGAFMLCEGVFLHSNVETPYAGALRGRRVPALQPAAGPPGAHRAAFHPQSLGSGLRQVGPGFLPAHLRPQHELDAACLGKAHLWQQDALHPGPHPQGAVRASHDRA